MSAQKKYITDTLKSVSPKHNNFLRLPQSGARGEVLSASDLQARYTAQLKNLLETARRLSNPRIIAALLGLMERRGMC